MNQAGLILQLQRTAGNRAVGAALGPMVVQRQEVPAQAPADEKPVPAEELPAEPVATSAPPQAPAPGTGVVLTDADKQRFAADPKPVDFYVQYHELALADQIATGVPALVTLAQMAFESNWAMGASASFFGVKGDPDGPASEVHWLWTTEPVTARDSVRERYKKYKEFAEKDPEPDKANYQVKLPFRKYSGAAEAIAGHSRALHGKGYAAAWSKSADPEEFAKAVAAAGYAAGAGYGEGLVSTIRTLNKAAAYAKDKDMLRGEDMLKHAKRMFDVLAADPSSNGIAKAHKLVPQAIPGSYAVLSDEGLKLELRRLREILVSMGVPPGVADEVCQP
ncbi:hypothetical protein AOZ06_16560 [Kibdelosporangium phytohabitans]|uniref:Mannosyl-glycoprotein endo-beta-N-acetylglucosamidase-like domain-containing protein n=1 Tax=Kibdelosporangium phytohabitans TaxID=860235 RepID=A0A0N9HYA8_9PSEU|nr:hypothetical protein AOZ06_16560 [Kibdelosporangium phytohabitans]